MLNVLCAPQMPIVKRIKYTTYEWVYFNRLHNQIQLRSKFYDFGFVKEKYVVLLNHPNDDFNKFYIRLASEEEIENNMAYRLSGWPKGKRTSFYCKEFFNTFDFNELPKTKKRKTVDELGESGIAAPGTLCTIGKHMLIEVDLTKAMLANTNK